MKVCVKTDIGLRDNNEDNYYIDENGKLLILADGMGGHLAGEHASEIAINTIKREIESYEEENNDELEDDENQVISMIISAVKLANKEIYTKSKNNLEYRGMGTTLSLVYLYNDKFYYLNIGDSRIYAIIDDKLEQLSYDDSFVNYLVELGEITSEEAKIHPQRNILTKALGTMEEIEVEILNMSIEKADIILLCTDGLSDVVSIQAMQEILQMDKPLQDRTDELVKTALEEGTKDNITVITLDRRQVI